MQTKNHARTHVHTHTLAVSDLNVVAPGTRVGISVADVELIDLIVPAVNELVEVGVALPHVLADVQAGVGCRLKHKTPNTELINGTINTCTNREQQSTRN